jgi:ankyrin repeat protein
MTRRMDRSTAKSLGIRAAVFGGTLLLSFVILGFMPSARTRRQTSFARAAAEGNVSRLRLLHMTGARINTPGDCCAPLFLAAGEGRLEVVRYLLDQGADVNARDTQGRTALTEAAFFGNIAVIRELALRGADLNAMSHDGTALDVAVKSNNAATIDVLRHYGAKRACELRGAC